MTRNGPSLSTCTPPSTTPHGFSPEEVSDARTAWQQVVKHCRRFTDQHGTTEMLVKLATAHSPKMQIAELKRSIIAKLNKDGWYLRRRVGAHRLLKVCQRPSVGEHAPRVTDGESCRKPQHSNFRKFFFSIFGESLRMVGFSVCTGALGSLPGARAADVTMSPPASIAAAPLVPSRNNCSSCSSSSSSSSGVG